MLINGIELRLANAPHIELIEEIKKLIIQSNQLNIRIGKLEEDNKKLRDENERLKKEITKIKRLNEKPKIQPSILEQKSQSGENKKRSNNKQSKLSKLKIDRTEKIYIPKDQLPVGAIFKGFKRKIVQELISKVEITEYLLAQYELSDGKYIFAKEPESIQGWSFGPELRSHIVYQSFKNRVPQQKIVDELTDKGIQISEGEINRIIEQTNEQLQKEKDELLNAGLQTKQIQVDDTGGRHKGKNGYSTVICNDFFTYIKTTYSKSRINFLEILRGNHSDYIVTQETIDYLNQYNFGSKIDLLKDLIGKQFINLKELDVFIQKNLYSKKHRQAIIEGALIGSLITHGFDPKTVIISDDAGQFNLFIHALCWIHIERSLKKLVPLNEIDSREIEEIRNDFWNYYQKLKDYKTNPLPEMKEFLLNEFDRIFTKYPTELPLSLILQSIRKNKKEMLIVLEYPKTPLHNNLSEINLREMVIKRKISAGTKSDKGREARDTFISLNKTCQKLDVSFWEYLNDRLAKKNEIPYLPDMVLDKYKQSLSP